ncbi:hypothetical protein TELCIR_01962 [Teladorsagia circumcincta]|uniref:Uncharacterized protein n=1 Tax=Teladorsagia circumcincta TaxID=45464 RepID=A0A2G9V0E7_TELCI|nr:hypothetical protein TELCIR_01962 [Teladorsagia circumcincta]
MTMSTMLFAILPYCWMAAKATILLTSPKYPEALSVKPKNYW